MKEFFSCDDISRNTPDNLLVKDYKPAQINIDIIDFHGRRKDAKEAMTPPKIEEKPEESAPRPFRIYSVRNFLTEFSGDQYPNKVREEGVEIA